MSSASMSRYHEEDTHTDMLGQSHRETKAHNNIESASVDGLCDHLMRKMLQQWILLFD